MKTLASGYFLKDPAKMVKHVSREVESRREREILNIVQARIMEIMSKSCLIDVQIMYNSCTNNYY